MACDCAKELARLRADLEQLILEMARAANVRLTMLEKEKNRL
jgi:hypothetical protein